MDNYKNKQYITWIKVTNPSTGEVYYTPEGENTTITLKNTITSNAVSASYFSGSISNAVNAVSASYALTASYFSGSITNAVTAVSSSYALTASYINGGTF